MKPIRCKCFFCGADLIRRQGPKHHFCNIKCKADYQRTLKPVSKEWLFDHYINKKMDCTQIAHIVNRDPKSVWNWLKDFGISTRPRGGFTCPNCFKKGETSAFKGYTHSEDCKQRLSEIARAEGRVPFDPQIGSYMKGRKGKDTPNWKGGLTPERQALYSSKDWSAVVKKIWSRDKAICQMCGKNHNTVDNRGTFHIHHIVSFDVKELRLNVDNLILLCRECHLWVHSKKNINKVFLGEIG